MEELALNAEPRETIGKKVKALRYLGTVPGVLYGPGLEALPIQVEGKRLREVLSQAGKDQPIKLTIGESGQVHTVRAAEIQRDPLTRAILHVDFLEV